MIFLVTLLFSVIIHEYMHGKIADRLGDPTARLAGRLTLNPIPHIDLFGSIILPFFLIISGTPILIGWAKPVPIDPFNLKNPRRDSAIIALFGPLSNFAIGILMMVFFRFLSPSEFFLTVARLNFSLAVLNLLPISPLDGFKVVGGILSQERAREWYQLERYGLMFFLLLLIPFGSSNMLSAILIPIVNFIMKLLGVEVGQFV